MIDRSTNPPTDTGPVIAAAQSRCRFELALDCAPRIALPELIRAQTRRERLVAWLRRFWQGLRDA